MLWLIITVMILGALAIILLPLFRTVKDQVNDRQLQNIQIAQQKIKKLKNDLHQGLITVDEYKVAEEDLEKMLHSDLENQSTKTEAVISDDPAYKTTLALAISLTAIVVALYFSLGSPSMVEKRTTNIVPGKITSPSPSTGGQLSDVKTLFDKLKQRLENNPNDGQGWKMMGLSYMHFRQFDEAVAAYTKAAALLADDNDVKQALERAIKSKSGETARSESVIANKKFIEKKMVAPNGQTVDVGAMVMRLKGKLDANPNNPQGWRMLGRSYSTLGLHEDAIKAYQQAQKLLPNDPVVTAELKAAIEVANMSNN
jgi:cytochrome c-type biogenesis protein CcmH